MLCSIHSTLEVSMNLKSSPPHKERQSPKLFPPQVSPKPPKPRRRRPQLHARLRPTPLPILDHPLRFRLRPSQRISKVNRIIIHHRLPIARKIIRRPTHLQRPPRRPATQTSQLQRHCPSCRTDLQTLPFSAQLH